LLLLASVFAATGLQNLEIGVNNDCTGDNRFFAGEDFYVCGTTEPGSVIELKLDNVISQEVVANAQGEFKAKGQANIIEHRVYYINALVNGEETRPIQVEVMTRCIQLPPSTVQAVPNKLSEGENFVIEVKNADAQLQMKVTGLKKEINAVVEKAEAWQMTVPASDCAKAGSSCKLEFEFTNTIHSLCHNNETSIEVRVDEKTQETSEKEQDYTVLYGAIAISFVVGGVIAYTMRKT